jgi:hypothetical protein
VHYRQIALLGIFKNSACIVACLPIDFLDRVLCRSSLDTVGLSKLAKRITRGNQSQPFSFSH